MWEYLTYYADDPFEQERSLNNFGQEGWELINIIPLGAVFFYTFKRPWKRKVK